ncbi:S24/S26 family peptidase [Parabacteroides pacaensis]|uniref:hypothetical protein n=1 Tax=Parabacteroides pacaensis TaxID=2086575 RepID=UPI000D0FD02F|nr:hypothetical protein [Parabacteroides pacaensis]
MEEKDKARSKRFIEVLEKLHISNQELKDKFKIDKTLKSKIVNGIQNASIDKIAAICEKYENANPEYILTGRGMPLKEENMLNNETINIPASNGIAVTSEKEYKEAVENGLRLLPEVTFKFAAGQAELINLTEDITRYWYLPDCKDCEGVAQIVGNSMTPALPAGCWVALKKYTLPRNNPNAIPFGNIFGVVIEDEITGDYHGHIKVIRRYKDPELSRKYWIAHSINEKEFDDFDIEIRRVKSLWIVKQHIVSDILL